MNQPLTDKLHAGENLTEPDIVAACDFLLDEKEPIATRADFLRALHHKGETSFEVAAFVRALLARSRQPAVPPGGLLDLCGTGGDRLGLFNISTAAMFVAAACGVRVVKHGNRGVTSRSGGADVLEALGVSLESPPERAGEILEEAGCLFLFAPFYHPTFRAVAPVRQSLAAEGTRTIFNILGPLLNPAQPDLQLAGVFDGKLLPLYADTFRLLGRERAWVVHGQAGASGLDEISTLGPTQVLALEAGRISAFAIDPSFLGLESPSLEALRGGSAGENAALISSLLAGEGSAPAADIVALNAAAAVVVAGCAADLAAALELARHALADGSAAAVLARLRRVA